MLRQLVRAVDSPLADGGDGEGDGGIGGDDRLIVDGVPHTEVGQIVVLLQDYALFRVVQGVVPPQQPVWNQGVEIDPRRGVRGKGGGNLLGHCHRPSGHVGNDPPLRTARAARSRPAPGEKA